MGTMRPPSRRMNKKAKPNIPVWGKALLIVVSLELGYFLFISSAHAIGIAIALACTFFLCVHVGNRRERQRLQRIATGRNGDSLCKFAREFDRRETDTWVIRAVHEELQTFLALVVKFPLRVTDLLVEDLGLEGEDVDDLIADVAERAGRSLEQSERNPYHSNVRTAADVVRFVNAQPPLRQNEDRK